MSLSKLSRATPRGFWRAVTCHRFSRFATCRQKQAAFSGPGKQWDAILAFDGDKSPAEIADRFAHSKTGGCGAAAL